MAIVEHPPFGRCGNDGVLADSMPEARGGLLEFDAFLHDVRIAM